MTEEAKKRMEELIKSIQQYCCCPGPTCSGCDKMAENLIEAGYKAGMCDPDAKKIFVGGVYWDAEKIEELIRNHTNKNVEAAKSLRESLVLIQKYKEENKRLREALDFALPELERLNCDAPISLSIHTGQVLINIKKALSSGGE